MKPVIESRLKELAELCIKRRVSKLYTFGSVNSAEFKEECDVDMLVEFQEIDIKEYADNYLDMCFDLELIFDRRVDLMTMCSVKNPIFKEEVEKTKELIYSLS